MADDKTVQALTLLHKLATSGLTSPSLSNAQEPEVFADLQNGRSAFSLNWPYVLASMKEANPALVPDLGYAPFPSVKPGEPPTTTLGGMNSRISSYSSAPGRGVRRGDVHALAGAPAPRDQRGGAADQPDRVRPAGDEGRIPDVRRDADRAAERRDAADLAGVPEHLDRAVDDAVAACGHRPADVDVLRLRSSIQDAIEGKGILP